MKILVIEPDEYYREHFTKTLGPLGELVLSREAAEASKLLDANPPDALVMELLLPDRSGYEFLEDIQDRPSAAFLPKIIFTHVDNLDDIQQALNLGVTGYFVKGRDTIRDINELLLTLSPP